MSYDQCLTKVRGGTKTSYHRHNGVSVGWVNSFLVSILFFLAEYFATFCGMSEVSEAGGRRARRCGENRPGRRPYGDFRSTVAPGARKRSERSEWSKNVAKYSAKKNKIPTKYEFTHPTETPLCLWYDVFVPILSSFILILNKLWWKITRYHTIDISNI